jgi:hypothetical protein
MPHVGVEEQQVVASSVFSISRTTSLRAASTGKPCEWISGAPRICRCAGSEALSAPLTRRS